MSHLRTVLAVVGTALAAWISQATLALTDAGAGSDRVALLPVSPVALAIALLAGALAAVASWRRLPLAPLALLVFLLLPWIPFDVPAAFLLWSGPMTILVWVGVVAALLPAVWRPALLQVTRPAVAAGLIAAAVYAVAAWRVSPAVPGGDEPHHLVITQSLLYDGDLRIENNHRRGDYLAYHPVELPPHYLRRGLDEEIYSIHAPGLGAVLVPAFAAGGYPGAVAFLVLMASLGSALAWHLAWLWTRSASAAWFGWAAVTLSATTIFHSFTAYPDGPAGIVVLTGVWAVLRAGAEPPGSGATRAWPWLLHGAALAALPWLHTRFALLAAALGAIVLVRLWTSGNALAKSLAFLVVPAVSCLGWFGYFLTLYGTPDPRAPYGQDIGQTSYIPDGIAGLLFDQRFGLLMYAPVLLVALVGLAAMLVRNAPGNSRSAASRRLAVELMLVVVPYLLVVTSYRMWWAGWSAPARFAMPIVPLLALPAADAWTRIRNRGTRATAMAALVFTVFATSVLVFADGGNLAYNVRTANSLWIDWLTRNVDLAGALPKWVLPSGDLFMDIAVWSSAMLLAWGVVRYVATTSKVQSTAALATATAALYATAAMIATSTVWSRHGADGTAPVSAQMHVLRQLGSGSDREIEDSEPKTQNAKLPTRNYAIQLGAKHLSVQLRPLRLIEPMALPSLLRLHLDLSIDPDDDAEAPAVSVLPAVPAGEYRLTPHIRGEGRRLVAGIRRNDVALWEAEPASPSGSILIDIPVDVRALVVWTDGRAPRPGKVILEPVSVRPAAQRLTRGYARRAARYQGTRIFFLDDRSYPEPEAFWVAGGGRSNLVLQPEEGRDRATLVVRNAPVTNHVLIEAGDWRAEMRMGPEEERLVHVPLDGGRGATLISLSSESGFVPARIDPASRDQRNLGIWIKVVPSP